MKRRAIQDVERGKLREVAGAFLRLGCISFGGPIAHLGYFREEFVSRRRWVTDAGYAELVALCQFLPGPASSQVVFALGMQRAGLAGALLASLCFTLPSAILMILFAYGVGAVADVQSAGWLHGLKLAAVAIVAQAVLGMGRKLCADAARIVLALLAALLSLRVPGVVGQIGAIAAGALAGRLFFVAPADSMATSEYSSRSRRAAGGALLAFFALLVALPALAAASGNFLLRQFDSFYRAGALVFGGGHVVLPLLRAEVVPPGWVSDSAFVAGYGAAQAVPGPLFTFAAYLGTVINPGPAAWLGGLWCLLAIFLPAWLLVGGALPFWSRIQSLPGARAALAGANAAVVGILLAAFYDPVWKQGIRSGLDIAVVGAAFLLLLTGKVPPWLAVILCAAAGHWL